MSGKMSAGIRLLVFLLLSGWFLARVGDFRIAADPAASGSRTPAGAESTAGNGASASGGRPAQTGGGIGVSAAENRSERRPRSIRALPNPANSPLDFNHMAGGEINKAGKAAGGHSLTTGGVRIVPGTEGAPDANGVYEAAIEIYDKAADRWVRKVSNNGITTMFPKDWTAERIKLEVQAAWDGPGKAMLPYNKWEGKTPSGVTVQGFVNPHRVTAHPLADF